AVSTSSTAMCIYDYNTANEYNIIKNNRLFGGYYSIYMYGPSSSNKEGGNIIEGNTIEGFYYYGIYLYYQEDIQIRGNYIENGTNSASVYGVRLYYCDNVEFTKNHLNIHATSTHYGIYAYYNAGTSTKHNLFANNFVALNGSGTGTWYGIYMYNHTYTDFYNNSFHLTGGSTSSGRCIYQSSGSNINLKNNILVNTGGGYTFYINTPTAILSSDYNDLYTTGSTLAYWSGAATNLATLQSNSYKDSNSVSIDPGFASASDLHLVTSAVNAKGIPLIPDVVDDIDGELRDTLAPDIGADEFTPLNKDLAAVQFTEPSDGYDAVGSQKDVKMAIRNQGIDTVWNFAVGYWVPGSSPVVETYTDTLYPGQLDTFAFSTQMTPAPGQFNMCGFTALVGEQDPTNDTTCMTYTGVPVLPTPYFTDFEGPTMYWFRAGGTNEWEYGIPNASTIGSAHSPSHAWATNLNGHYQNSSVDYLYSPKFDLSGFGVDTLKFWHWFDTESNNDGGTFQYLNIQDNWVTLGSQNDPYATNWYNTFSSGQYRWSGQSNGWILSTYDLSAVNDFGSITQFRFAFTSNTSNNSYDGWAVDDFELTLPKIPNDGGVTAIITPTDTTTLGTNVTVQVEIHNFGADVLDTIPVSYSVNNGIPVTETWYGTLAQNATMTYTFTTTYPAPTLANYSICAFTQVPGDVYYFNDSTCKSIVTQLPPIDAGISLLVYPWDTTCVHKDYQVTVRIRNYGLNTLTSIPLAFRFKTNSPVIETWTGSLSPGDSTDYTFNQSYNSTLLIGNYSLCAYTQVNNDGYHLNDTSCNNIINVVCLPDGIEDNDMKSFWLGQNIPNPANGMTTIRYHIPNSGEVNFVIMNLLGETVYEEQGAVSAGIQHVEIDVTTMPSGVYYYTVEYKGKRLVKKMIISK
ncbi:T9SS type A sorting domain-containing protein, partial [candidate division KSB1 bacterium]